MALETVTYITDLNAANPTAGDPVSQADDHLRNIKTALRNAGLTLDSAYGEYTANANLATTIPLDDTIPQNTEGTQIITVSLTPKSITSRVRLRFRGFCSLSAAGNACAAIFSSASADALTATVQAVAAADQGFVLECSHEYVPGVTTAITYSVRVGPATALTMCMNGTTAARYFGGVAKATLIVEEIQA